MIQGYKYIGLVIAGCSSHITARGAAGPASTYKYYLPFVRTHIHALLHTFLVPRITQSLVFRDEKQTEKMT